MPAFSRTRQAACIAAGVVALFFAAAAGAQAPPPYPPGEAPPPYPGAAPLPPGPPGEADQIRGCLCDEQALGRLHRTIDDKENSLHQIRRQLAELNAQLARERPKVDVTNPDSVARYKALLERHDALYQRSVGSVAADTTGAVKRYNARVADYNHRCAHQLFDAGLMAQVRAHLVCPGPR